MPVCAAESGPAPAAQRADRALYEKYLPIVRRVALKLVRRLPSQITLDDLIGAGWVGMIEALRKRAAIPGDEQFEAYAGYRVRGAILDYLRSLDPMTRRIRGGSRQVAAAQRALSAQLMRAPSEEEIAERLGVSLEHYHALLYEVALCDHARTELGELHHRHGANDAAPDAIASRMELAGELTFAVAAMPDRLQVLLALYYRDDRTFREVGEVLGLTEARICQLHADAIARLRAHLSSLDDAAM